SEALAALGRGGGFTRVVLRGLSRDEVAAYIRDTARVEVSAGLLVRLVEETEGNPFFLTEVVNLLVQEGTLTAERVSDIRVPDGGTGRWAGHGSGAGARGRTSGRRGWPATLARRQCSGHGTRQRPSTTQSWQRIRPKRPRPGMRRHGTMSRR